MSRALSGFAVVLAAALMARCGSNAPSPTPTPNAPVRVSIRALPTFVGGASLFSIGLENISGSPVNLTFPSSCTVLPYFSDRAGRAVTPVGGGFACLTVITQLTLNPGVSLFQTYTVKAGTAGESQVIVLPAGEYSIRGRLEDNLYKVESAPLTFTVQ